MWQVPGAGWAQIVAFAGNGFRESFNWLQAKCAQCLKGFPGPLSTHFEAEERLQVVRLGSPFETVGLWASMKQQKNFCWRNSYI